jgi:hypothetical protein
VVPAELEAGGDLWLWRRTPRGIFRIERIDRRELVLLKGFGASTALLVLIAVAVASNATATSTSARVQKGKSVTLHLVRKDVGFNFVDNPPRQGFNSPPLIGDQFAFTADLLTTTGARTGTFDATCTVTRGGVNTRQACFGFYSLKGGQISGMALATNNNTTHISIVGGTGVYEGVTGSAVEVSRGQNSPITDITLHLIYP